MALPTFRDDGWLPEGHHATTWDEIAAIFGGDAGSRRRNVLSDLLGWRDALRAKGMGGRLILNGSFISLRREPGDFDCYFLYDEVSAAIVKNDPTAALLVNYGFCKAIYRGDVLVFAEASVRDFPQFCRIDGFDLEKTTLRPKGVIEVTV